jgi:hypothetical protein
MKAMNEIPIPETTGRVNDQDQKNENIKKFKKL